MSERSEIDAIDAVDRSVGRAKAMVGFARDCMEGEKKPNVQMLNSDDLFGALCLLYSLLEEAEEALADMSKYRPAHMGRWRAG